MVEDTISSRQQLALTTLRILVALAFVFLGSLKLIGDPMMVTVFEQVGLGQWFRYVTGTIEVGGALLLLTPRFVGAAAVLLLVTAIGAVVAHLTVVPGPPVPAVLLLILTGVLAWFYRASVAGLLGSPRTRSVTS